MMKKTYRLLGLVCVLYAMMTMQLFASQKVLIPNVPIIGQHPELPTGCEATALTMLLNYYDIDVTKEEVARVMPKAGRPYMHNGRLYGQSPEKFFIGDPFSTSGFGVFAPVMMQVADTYLPGRVMDLSGGNFDAIYKALDQGRPVMFWATIGMDKVRVNSRWLTPDGETVVWKTPEHALVAVGYDENYIYMNDPYTGSQRKYSKSIVENRWIEMGRQAFAIADAPVVPIGPQMVESLDAKIEGIIYSDLIYVDDTGEEWLKLASVEGLHGGTKTTYHTDTGGVSLVIKEQYPIPSDISKWIGSNTQGLEQAIPRNIDGKYHLMITLDEIAGSIITYNSSGKKVILKHYEVDGVKYVTKDWVEAFYKLKIEDM